MKISEFYERVALLAEKRDQEPDPALKEEYELQRLEFMKKNNPGITLEKLGPYIRGEDT